MKRNSKLLRTLSVLAVIALVCLGLALHTGTGTPSAWGIYDLSLIHISEPLSLIHISEPTRH